MTNVLLFMPSGYEIVIILVVVVLLFGGKKIPELMRGLGKGLKEFKNATNETQDMKKEIDEVASGLKKDSTPPKSVEKESANDKKPDDNKNN